MGERSSPKQRVAFPTTHLLLETPSPNLSRGMKLLNGVYTQRFNRHHKRCGHLLQGSAWGQSFDLGIREASNRLYVEPNDAGSESRDTYAIPVAGW